MFSFLPPLYLSVSPAGSVFITGHSPPRTTQNAAQRAVGELLQDNQRGVPRLGHPPWRRHNRLACRDRGNSRRLQGRLHPKLCFSGSLEGSRGILLIHMHYTSFVCLFLIIIIIIIWSRRCTLSDVREKNIDSITILCRMCESIVPILVTVLVLQFIVKTRSVF